MCDDKCVKCILKEKEERIRFLETNTEYLETMLHNLRVAACKVSSLAAIRGWHSRRCKGGISPCTCAMYEMRSVLHSLSTADGNYDFESLNEET